MKRVVILGGGFGGAAAAVALSQVRSEHTITLIDRHETNYLAGDNPFIAVGQRDRYQVSRHLSDIARYGARFVEAEIDRIEVGERIVRTSVGGFDFDYLIIALGASYDWDAIPGSREAHGFYDLARAERLWGRLAEFRGGTIAMGVSGTPIKCPPAPFETSMMIDWWLRERGLRAATEMHVSIPGPAPLAIAGPAASRQVAAELEKRGIQVHTGVTVEQVGPRSAAFSDGSEIVADVVITIPLHRPPSVVGGSGLLGNDAWIHVDRATLETSVPNVFAIGDVNVIPIGEKALPKAGVFAAGQGRTTAAVIAARIDGTELPRPYDGTGRCFMAFSATEGTQVGGRFFAEGGPDISLDPPSAEGMRGKELFDLDWRTFQV